MPRFDATGPMGYGPGTGRGMGPCGAGMARGRGRGFGFRRFLGYMPYQGEITKKEETKILEDDAAILEEELAGIKTRLKELKDQK